MWASWAAAWPTSSWSSTSTARTRWCCATPATTRPTSRSRASRWPARRRRSSSPTEEVATPERGHHRGAGRVARGPPHRTAKAVLLRHRRRTRSITAIVRGDFEVNETKLANVVQAVARPAPRDRRRDQGRRAWSPATPRPSARTTRRSWSTTLAAALAEPGGRRQPAGFHLRNVNAGRDFTADMVDRHRRRPRRRRLPGVRRSRCAWPRASRSATSSSSAPTSPTTAGRHVPGRGRQPPPRDHGLLRDRAGAAAGLHRGGAPRREGHRLADKRSRPTRSTWWPWVPERTRRWLRRPTGSIAPTGGRRRRAVRRPRRVGRRQADRCRAAGHAHHRHHLAALPCRRRGRGHDPWQRRSHGAADRRRGDRAHRRLARGTLVPCRAIRTSPTHSTS